MSLEAKDFEGLSTEAKFHLLDEASRKSWEELLRDSALIASLRAGALNRAVFARYLVQTYHYTFHDARNHALGAVRSDVRDIRYIKYCLNHAADEAGHEQMALHDI